MGVGDCDRERVGGIGASDLRAWKQAGDHRVDLRLLGGAGADNRFLDEAWRILADGDSGAGRAHQHDSPSLAELERRLRVLVDEHFLGRGRLGRMLAQQRFELVGEVREPLAERRGGGGPELAVGDVAEPVAFGADQAPAGRAEAGVETQDDQPSFSSSSSGTS